MESVLENSAVVADAKGVLNVAIVKAWLSDEAHLENLLKLGLEISGYKIGFAKIRSGDKLIIGAQSGTNFPQLAFEGSFLESIENDEQPEECKLIEGKGLDCFRHNPLLIEHPSIVSVLLIPIRSAASASLGCLLMASDEYVSLNETKETHCKVVAKQFGIQLELYQKMFELRSSQSKVQKINVELERFASVAAHDLRSPLRAMGSFAGLLRRRVIEKLSAEEIEYVDHIRSGATRLSAMVEGLLNLAKANHEDYSLYENIDIHNLVAEIADLIDPDQHHVIEFTGISKRLEGSKSAIKQILLNLISNAVKYHHLPSGTIHVSVTKKDTDYLIAVIDDGPGIAKSDQEDIFKAFVTGTVVPRVPGTGLGLALVRSVADRLGGSLTLESALGKGSTFTVRIPIRSPNELL